MHEDLFKQLLQPLFAKKTVVSSARFRLLFPALDAAVRCKPVNANFHKALLVVAVHCNPAIRGPSPSSSDGGGSGGGGAVPSKSDGW